MASLQRTLVVTFLTSSILREILTRTQGKRYTIFELHDMGLRDPYAAFYSLPNKNGMKCKKIDGIVYFYSEESNK